MLKLSSREFGGRFLALMSPENRPLACGLDYSNDSSSYNRLLMVWRRYCRVGMAIAGETASWFGLLSVGSELVGLY